MSNKTVYDKDDAKTNVPADGQVGKTKIARRPTLAAGLGQETLVRSEQNVHDSLLPKDDGVCTSPASAEISRNDSTKGGKQSSGSACIEWLQQKKLRQMEYFLRSSSSLGKESTTKEDTSTSSITSGENSTARARVRRGSLFKKLVEQGVNVEEAENRQKVYSKLKLVVGSTVDDTD